MNILNKTQKGNVKRKKLLDFIQAEIEFVKRHLDYSEHEVPRGKAHLQGRLWELKYIKEVIETESYTD